MKHTLKITLLLVLFFIMAQVVGLAIINQYIDTKKTQETGVTTYEQLPFDIERPEVEQSYSYIYIIIAVIIGTILLLVLIKHRKVTLWKTWFFLSVALCLTVAFGAFLPEKVALFLAILLALFKILKPNIYIHNITELFIYGGLAAIFVPVINLFSAFILLAFISLYDMFAVWKSRHMVKMAEFQSSSKLFAGLFIPYKAKQEEEAKKIKMKKETGKPKLTMKIPVASKQAILGGGDIGFPLIFAGVVMKSVGFMNALIIPLFVALALFILLVKSKKNRYYPAMPFISIGCVAGYLVVLFLN